jgi:tRNA(Arg) A34 adenosine deaminase TadA
MRTSLAMLLLVLSPIATLAQESIDASYFITSNRKEYVEKLVALPCDIRADDPIPIILHKLKLFLDAYQPNEDYADDSLAKESNLQALKSVEEGGYGIGAVLVDANGRILLSAHNEQIQRHRSDLHGEMTLLTRFEESSESKLFLNGYLYKPGLTVFSSAEPCPMCFIRLASAGVNTRYCTPGPDDGMVNRVDCLPTYWKLLASKRTFKRGNCSLVMQKLSHLLFFSYHLDNRGPKED